MAKDGKTIVWFCMVCTYLCRWEKAHVFLLELTGCNYKKTSGFNQPIIKVMINIENVCGFSNQTQTGSPSLHLKTHVLFLEDILSQYRVKYLPV